MIVATSNAALDEYVSSFPRGCAFVPTMGALHEGHGTLVRLGAGLARDRGLTAGCIVSIFVNPTQFDDKSDFERYPQTLDADLARCREAGAACVYAPAVQDIYPPGGIAPLPQLPQVATRPQLEDAFRPGHFAGVCQVVARLFELTQPAVAVFGEKDWQQLQVVRAMVAMMGTKSRGTNAPLDIIGVPTVREDDGLAMSSRNRFLSTAERKTALIISRALHEGRKGRTSHEAQTVMKWTLAKAGVMPDYAVVREAETLEYHKNVIPGTTYRALITARVGPVRLLDNAPWSPCAE
ncbi:MAG: 4-phosphopantoate--beta-alanine ligase [Phycisphaerales bacterium]